MKKAYIAIAAVGILILIICSELAAILGAITIIFFDTCSPDINCGVYNQQHFGQYMLRAKKKICNVCRDGLLWSEYEILIFALSGGLLYV